jgi:hypothetical protein
MALVQITDVVVPARFAAYVQVLTAQKSALIASGVVAVDAFLAGLLAGGGATFNLPFWNDLADTEANTSGDEKADYSGAAVNSPLTDAVPLALTTGREIAVRVNRNQNWSAADLSGALAGSDPMDAIANRVADYWVRQDQRLFIAATQGVIADNIANDSGDMIENIATSGSVTDANRFSAEAFIDAQQTMGDRGSDLTAVVCHSIVEARMKKLNLIDYIPDSNGVVNIPTYQGKRLIVDDGMPVFNTGSNPSTSIWLFGASAFGMGEGSPRVPSAVSRYELAGKGGGQEVLTSRREFILHPRGFAFVGSPAGESPTNTEFATATSWDRRVERKLIRFAELRVNI